MRHHHQRNSTIPLTGTGPAEKITYIGHATLLIETAGARFLTDPLLRDWVWHLRRQHTGVERHWYQDLDAVLISHMHYDHLDIPSLKMLGKKTPLIVPRGAGKMLHRQGFRYVEEAAVGDTLHIGKTRIEVTFAQHDGSRFRFGPGADSLGFLIDGSQRIYFAGDTDLFPEMSQLAHNLDVALLPIWGWGPTLGTGHMDPYRAALALQLLRPRLAIPIHWGTFFPIGLRWVLPELLTHPPHTFAQFADELAADVQIQIVKPGRHIHLNGRG